jgi:spore coat protein A
MEISRREFLKLGLAGGVALALPLGASACSGEGSTGTLLPSRAKLPEPLEVPLPIPPMLEPERADAGIDYYEMTQRVGKAEILPGLETEVWGYDGIFPGPTIEPRGGRKIVVRQRNALPVPVSTHLPGGRTPPDSDGYPTDLIMPKKMHHRSMGGSGSMDMGGSKDFKDYTYPLAQRAATLWYHDHRIDFTGPQVWRGLAGFHIVRDDDEDALPLPKGEKDVPLMICDRSFDRDGSFLYPSLDPATTQTGRRGRLYGWGARGHHPGQRRPLAGARGLEHQVQVPHPQRLQRPPLRARPSAGKRSLRPGRQRRGFARRADPAPYHLYGASRASRRGSRFLEVRRRRRGHAKEPHERGQDRRRDALPRHQYGERHELEESNANRTRVFRFTRVGDEGRAMWEINGETFDPGHMAARPELSFAEVWHLRAAPASHPIHLHLVHFKVLSRNNGKPLPTDAGWKDTVGLSSGEEARVLVRFDGYRGRYVFHCHNLEHEDMMMANFEVT